MSRATSLTLSTLACCAALFVSACATCDTSAGGPKVKLVEPGRIREVPAACVDEKSYAARGWIKNTDAHGNAIYVRIPATDQKKDATFITGSNSGKERSFGGLGGAFTGRPER